MRDQKLSLPSSESAHPRSREELLKRERERLREAHRVVAGLLLVQQIENDLIESGTMSDDEFVELVRDQSGNPVATIKKISE